MAHTKTFCISKYIIFIAFLNKNLRIMIGFCAFLTHKRENNMNFFESLSFIRRRLNLSQGEMLENTSHSTYSRIESGKRQMKLEQLKLIADKFGMNLKELLEFSNIDTEYEKFVNFFRNCAEEPDNESNKEKLITTFFPKKKLHDMNSYELTYYYSIKGYMGTKWPEIGIPTAKDLEFIDNYLSGKSFYTQKDYHIAMNIINHFPLKQRTKIVEKMYPVILPEKRTDSLKKYANHMVTNLISSCIYELEYEIALKYVELAENTMDFSVDYYLRLNILYHKNVLLRYLKQDTLYIERAREIIKIMYAISDPSTAEQFETELNNLDKDPKYYSDNKSYPRTIVKE